MKVWAAQLLSSTAFGYTCDSMANGHCVSGCLPHEEMDFYPKNRCKCNYDGAVCKDREWCSCFAVPKGRCMSGCNPKWTTDRNRCQCNYDNTPCNDWECTPPPVTNIRLSLKPMFECDGGSGSSGTYDIMVTVGRKSSTDITRSSEMSHTSTVSVSASIGEDAAKMSFSKEEQDFVKHVSSFAESMEDESETTIKWTIHIDCHSEQHLYQGQVMYTFADGSTSMLSDRSYHLTNKAPPSLVLQGSVVPRMSNTTSLLV